MTSGPAIPRYVLRGHLSSVHDLLFFNENLYLASGDNHGWLIVWNTVSKRPLAVWKAHDSGVVGIKQWDRKRLITHGRDHKLRVWNTALEPESHLSNQLPVDGAPTNQPQPWLLHSMDISALNFCTFATCSIPTENGHQDGELLVASPNGLDSGSIDLFHLPSERRVSQLHSSEDDKTGMAMSLAVFLNTTGKLCLISGYEDGRVVVYSHTGSALTGTGCWQKLMQHKPHTQPILSLAVSTSLAFFVTSSADAILAKFPVPHGDQSSTGDVPTKVVNTKHAGQQSLSLRSDNKIFATAGWDARIRVYSARTMKELAVLKWHKDGCSSTAFAEIQDTVPEQAVTQNEAIPFPANSSALDKLKEERVAKARTIHWLAAGGKDGKITLWDIY